MNDAINHGFGIVEFQDIVKFDFADIETEINSLADKAISENFKIIRDEDGTPIHAVNQGGFIYSIENMNLAPLRLQALGPNIYNIFEPAIYSALLKYIEIFPAILTCLWWRTTGHILKYSKGGSLGLHSDNDVNYRYGFEPKEEHATRNVVSAIVFLNDWSEHSENGKFTGGEMIFPYADVTIFPKSGNVLMFPANYVAAHEIATVTSGSRYTYLGWFAQGSAMPAKGISPQPDISVNGGQVWLNSLVEDYDSYINSKYGGNPPDVSVAHRSRSNDHEQ